MTLGTKQFRKRNAILAYLQSTDVHPSAEMVFAHLKPEISDLSLGTVYRNLAMFRQQGIIASIGTVAGVERFDGDVNPHVHFVCTDCGSVTDLHSLPISEAMTRTAEQLTGGRVDQCQLTFTGLCGTCVKTYKQGGETA